MLAGRVKLKNFLIAVVILGVLGSAAFLALGGLGLIAAFLAPDPVVLEPAHADRGPATPNAPDPVTDATPPEPVPPAGDPLEGLPAEREADRAVSSRVGTDLGAKKLKDVTKGQPYKVNLYQDEGHATLNRAKIDLDRDDQWDEKWTIDGHSISRKVSPGDDQDYSVSQVWSDGGWVEP